ncbi:Peptidase family M41 [Lachnospiraceae bacterium XBB2008]|nr:Peptidase family M41 [Lachnospiraceae bacterium XBB2008]
MLFIDEAYSLVDAEETGKEVIEALITAMVDHKEDTIFIFAGYYDEMRKFLEINPGIPSRIGYTFVFEDYKTDELLRIFHDQMDEAGFTISEGVDAKVKGIFEYFREMPQFGNGRFVEQLISRIISKRAERDYNNTDYSRIDECDIPEISDLIDTNSSGLRLHDPQKITDESRLRTAYHELGHAIAIYEFKPTLDMEKISICDGAMSLGRVSFKRLGRNRTEEELQNEIAINLAGRCAERVFFGNCDEGCVSDYESAVEISKNMIEKYGMCDIGLTKPEDLLREADRQATKVIQKYQTCIEKIAEELIKGKEFSGEEFAEYVKKYSD